MLAGLYFRLLRRQKKNPASANATTARVAPTAIPATAPDDNSLLSLLEELGEELELELPADASDVDVEVVSASEAVVPAVVAGLSPVDLGGYIPSVHDPSIIYRTTYRSVDGRVHLIIHLAHTRHQPLLPRLLPLKIRAHKNRTIRDTIQIPFRPILYIRYPIRIILSPKRHVPLLFIAIVCRHKAWSRSAFLVDYVGAVAY